MTHINSSMDIKLFLHCYINLNWSWHTPFQGFSQFNFIIFYLEFFCISELVSLSAFNRALCWPYKQNPKVAFLCIRSETFQLWRELSVLWSLDRFTPGHWGVLVSFSGVGKVMGMRGWHLWTPDIFLLLFRLYSVVSLEPQTWDFLRPGTFPYTEY